MTTTLTKPTEQAADQRRDWHGAGIGTVLFARCISDLVRTAIQLVILLVFATILFGFSPAGGLAGVVAALLLALTVSWALTWVFLAIAAWLRNEEAMQSVGFLAMFP